MRSLTVELRHHLDTDLCYWIDSAQEDHRIAPDTAVWARHFCPDLARVIDRTPERLAEPCSYDQWLESRDDGVAQVERAYLDWLDAVDTPKEHKLATVGIGRVEVHNFIAEVAKYAADLTVYEHIPLRAPHRFPPNLDTSKAKFTITANNPCHTGGNYTISIFDMDSFKKQNKFWNNSIKHVHRMHKRYGRFASGLPETIRVRHVGRPAIVHGFADPKARKTVRRGIELLTDLVGYEAVRSFVTGKQPLVIDGAVLSYHLKLSSVGGARSHGSMTTEVWLGDRRICNLCIYTPDTPPLDHVTNFITQIRLGLESEVIETGNPLLVEASEPTGIDMLDRRLFHRSPHRIRVSSIRPPVIDLADDHDWDGLRVIEDDDSDAHVMRPDAARYEIRLGNSTLTDTIVAKRSQRVLRDLYRNDLAGISFRSPRIIEV